MAKKKQEPLGISLERTAVPSSSGGAGGAIWILFALLLAVAVYLSARYWWRSEESPASSEIAQTASPSPTPALLPAATPSPAPALHSLATPRPQPIATPALSSAPSQSLPTSVTLTKAAQLAIMQEGHITGYVYLRPGQQLTPVGRDGSNILVSWGQERGVIPASATDLRQ